MRMMPGTQQAKQLILWRLKAAFMRLGVDSRWTAQAPLTPFIPFNSILERGPRCWHSNAYFSLFSSLFFLA